ncbi:type II toxin-antitoxin system TacA family antitoxin [Marinoscillum pacificum]|uniref:type II toxin-antitoxin system TacA family antitoxin n=1 Tax=Marinoscillum pacificum TaxID=392723 RepID=UPI002157B7E4|nr:DUF1778 domain-containing protein [Marinoscillum pacificum]
MDTNEVARFDAKMSVLHKKLLEEAASLKGFRNLTEYVITTMVEDAKAVVEEYSKVLYSIEDKKRIMKILNEPTELSDSFLKASQKRSKRLDNEIYNS